MKTGTILKIDCENDVMVSVKPSDNSMDESTVIKTHMKLDCIKTAWKDVTGISHTAVSGMVAWAQNNDITEVVKKLRQTYIVSLVKSVDACRRHCYDDMIIAPIEIMLEVGAWFTENGEWSFPRIEEFIKISTETIRNGGLEPWKIIVDYSGNGTIFIDLAGPEFRVQKYPNFIDRVGFML